MREQLEAGIRYLDIRLGGEPGDRRVVHGIVDQDLGFDAVLRTTRAFLEANPSEVVLMRVTPGVDQAYSKTYPNLYVDKPNINDALGDIRGRVIFLSREKDGKHRIYLNDEDQIDLYDKFQTVAGESLENIDDKAATIPRKIADIKQRLHTGTQTPKDPLRLTHLSGTIAPADKQNLSADMLDIIGKLNPFMDSADTEPVPEFIYWPSRVAKLVAPEVYNTLRETNARLSAGVLIMDYPGEHLI